MTESNEDQFWHDLIKGMHMRALYKTDDWVSWQDAAKQFYGAKKYDYIKYEYDRHLTENYK